MAAKVDYGASGLDWKYYNNEFMTTVYSSTLAAVYSRYTDNDFEQSSLYYLRVTQEGQPLELAWTSPVWVNIQE